jgi:hypothetical protein
MFDVEAKVVRWILGAVCTVTRARLDSPPGIRNSPLAREVGPRR